MYPLDQWGAPFPHRWMSFLALRVKHLDALYFSPPTTNGQVK